MKKIVLLERLIAGIVLSVVCNSNSFGQCVNSNSIGTNKGSISPISNWQTISCVKGGDYYTFTGVAGTPYSFSFCVGGGEATWDTQISICDDDVVAAMAPGAYNFDDDFCAFAGGSHITFWTPLVTKSYRVYVTEYNCVVNNTCAILAYKRESIPGTGNTCATARNITIPYDGFDLSTCNRGDTYNQFNTTCASSYLDGEDMVFKFSGTAGQCISIYTEHTFAYTGLFLTYGCPDVGVCIAMDAQVPGWPSRSNVTLPSTGFYYITVSTEPTPDCTPFDLHVVNCPPPATGSTCGTAYNIPALPFYGYGFTTCGRGNAYTSAYSCTSNFMNGEDYVFSYTSPGNECVDILISNTFTYTGLFVSYGCPTVGGTNCIDKVEDISGNPTARYVSLTAAGTYYFIVSTNPASGPLCTPFHIKVKPCVATCGLNPPPGDVCGAATLLSPLTTFCGTTNPPPTFNPDAPGNLAPTFCGSIENNSWFSFVAPSTTIDFQVVVSNCANGLGIQAEVFSTPNCNTFTAVSTCYNPMGPWNGHVIASGLTPGNTYYLMIDGYASDECDYTITPFVGGGGPLPVTMSDLDGKVDEEVVNLNWRTFSESNNKGFYIQRGVDFDSPERISIRWENVGYLEGAGTTTETNKYDFSETPPFNGDGYYYRVMQMDQNGMTSFSETVHLNPTAPSGDVVLKLYPNPTDGHIVVSYALAKDSEVNITVTNSAGFVVRSNQIGNENAGSHEVELELGDLASGIYFLTLKGSSAPIVNKFSILK